MKKLVVITGPTASGKTSVAIELAKRFRTEIISADSRQIYRGIEIGTAAPSSEELAAVPHHFIGSLGIEEYFSAALFEERAIEKINRLFESYEIVILCGGSMLYVDAVVNGIDDIPTISTETRERVTGILNTEGKDGLLSMLEKLDREYYDIVDKNNIKRVVHALEIILQSKSTYTSLRTGRKKKREFEIIKFAIEIPRDILFDRINSRVDLMVGKGLENEARCMYRYKNLNSLNTVGFKEMFSYFNGDMDFPTAIERIKKNTRVFAKKQMTWLKKSDDVIYIPSTGNTMETVDKICIKLSELYNDNIKK